MATHESGRAETGIVEGVGEKDAVSSPPRSTQSLASRSFLVTTITAAVVSSSVTAIAFFTLPVHDWLLRLEGYSVVIEQSRQRVPSALRDAGPAEYIVHNLTGEPVKVLKVRPCCGAIVLTELPLEIPPKGSKEVRVQPPTSTTSGFMEVEFRIDRQSPPLVMKTPLEAKEH